MPAYKSGILLPGQKEDNMNMERDRRVEKELEALDWTVIRFWGNDIKKDLEGCLQVIEEAAFDKMINSCASEGNYDDT